MIRLRTGIAVLILACAPAVSQGQVFGAAFGGWMTTGAKEGNEPAVGFRLSGSYDRPFRTNARWRIEAAFVQAGFSRDFPDRPNRHVTENSIEVGIHLSSRPFGGSAFRAFLGPVVSVGIGCGTDGFNDSNGRVACDGDGGDGTTRLGAALGLQAEWGNARQFMVNLQGQGNTVAATRGQGPVIAATFGFRFPR